MYEFELVDRDARRRLFDAHPELVVDRVPANFSRAARISMQAWSEHCTECAEPQCYTTCDLYRRRPDGRCRRFSYGIYPNRRVRTWLPYSAEVDFGFIAHIWTKGNVKTVPLALYRALDAVQRLAARMANGLSTLLLPISPKRKVTRGFYHYRKLLVAALQRWGYRKADGLLVQMINPHPGTLELRVEAYPDPRVPGQPFFQTRFELTPGFTEHWIPVSALAERLDLDGPFEISMLIGTAEPRLIYILCAEFVSGLSGPITQRLGRTAHDVTADPNEPAAAPKVKAVVWDLDNTLWEGVLAESEDTPPALRPGIAGVIQGLDQRGILQSVASKNDHEAAWARLESLGLAEYFLYPQINWEPKSSNVRTIVERLNIAADTVVVIDDQPFERGEVVANLPGVASLPETAIPGLLADPRFAGTSSVEARSRRSFYRTQVDREAARIGQSGDYVEFLRDCHMVVQVHAPRLDEAERIHELIQRTNQMNFSGNRYGRETLLERLARQDLDAFVLHCRDRFGDYGIVGFCMVERRGTVARMVDLALSCRIQAKHVEHAFLLALLGSYRNRGFALLEAEYRRTERNVPAARVFDDLSFRRAPDEDGREVYGYELARSRGAIDYVDVQMEADCASAGPRPPGI